MDRLTGKSTRQELPSKGELSTEATERIAEAISQGRANNPSNRLLELRNRMERPNQQRGPRVMEQRRLNRQERRDQRNEAARLNREPEHERKLREKECERPRCRGDEAIIKHICRECNAEACDDCKTDHKHNRASRSCTTETWERAPTRSDYTTGHEHVGLTARNRFDEGTRRGEVLGYLTHRGEKWYLVKWDLGQEMEIDEDMFTDCRLAEIEHDRDGTEPEQNTIEQGRRGYRPPEPRERKEEQEGKEESPPARVEPQAERRSEDHRS
jgi:hypothetical protein